MELTQTDIDRFWSKVDKTEGCWNWTAGKDRDGYGRFKVSRRSIEAHRISYLLANGSLPDTGFVTDHLCRVRSCVNPHHLEAVTPKENSIRGEVGLREKLRTHCPAGHVYTTENTYLERGLKRKCKTCDRARKRVQARLKNGVQTSI